MKRRAPYELNRRDLEENNYEAPDDQSGEAEDQQPVDLSQRRIVKLRNPSEVYAEKRSEAAPAGKFNLAGNLEGTNGTSQQNTNETPSFLSAAKPENLFSNNHANNGGEAQPAKSLWGDQSKFSNISISSSLFTNNKPQEAAKPQEEPKPAVEEKPASTHENGTAAGGSLFPSNTPATNPLLGGGSLFGGSLFANKEGTSSTSLFGNLLNTSSNQSSSLFGNYLNNGTKTFDDLLKSSTSNNIFAAQKADSDEEGGEGDDEPQRSDSPEPDITKTEGSYKYEEHTERIIIKSVDKFKLNDSSNTSKGTIALEKAKDSNIYMVVFRDTAKITRYQGLVFKGASKVKHIYDNKPHTLSIVCYSAKKEDETKPEADTANGEETKKAAGGFSSKFNRDLVKLMFPIVEDCSQIKDAITNVVQG